VFTLAFAFELAFAFVFAFVFAFALALALVELGVVVVGFVVAVVWPLPSAYVGFDAGCAGAGDGV
jgi:hypothetical protein